MDRTRRLLRLVLATALLGVIAPAGTAHAAATGDLLFGSFGGNAYGTKASVITGDIATKLGRSAYITSGCDGTGGVVKSNTVDTVDAGPAAKAQQIYTTAFSDKTATTGVVRHTAKVEGVRLLGGRVKADAVKAVARTRADETTARSDAHGSKFVDLVVDGEQIASPKANTKIKLRGIGFLKFKSVERSGDGEDSSGISLDMLRVVVKKDNRFDLPIGAEIVVAHAASKFRRVEPAAVVDGNAFAASATSQVGEVENRVGRAAAIYLGCRGTEGKVLSNNVELLDAPGLVVSGTGRTTAEGDVTSTPTYAKTTARLQDVNLLGGLITADVVKAVARTTWEPATGGIASAAGSKFVNLSVLDVPFAVTPPPNTEVLLPGIGHVVLNEQKLSSDGDATGATAKVIMIHVFVDEVDNALGLPAGTELTIASAKSAVHPFN
jgi:hypothetical protein